MPELITDLHVRVSQQELDSLRQMGAIRQAPVSSVVRAMIRHFVIEWEAGRDVTVQLGAIVWRRPER